MAWTQQSEPVYPPAIAAASNLAQTEGSPAMLRVNPTTGALKTEVTGAGSGGTSAVDGDSFTAGSSALTPGGGVYNDSVANLSSGATGELRLTTARAQHVNVRNASGTEMGTLANPFRVSEVGIPTMQIVDGSGNAVSVTGNKLDVNATVSGSNPAASATGAAVPASASYNGIKVGANLLGQTGVNPSGSIEAADTNIASVAGTTIDTNSGNKSAGSIRVVIATDQVALTNKLLVTPDLPSGASTAAKQPALGTAGTASADVITVQGIASMTPLLVTPTTNAAVNVAQINGVTPLMGAGNTGTGSPRVTIATDQAAIPVSESGTWTVQPGNTPNSTAWLVTDTPSASGGLSKFHLVGAATDNATNVKASAGQVYAITAFNLNAAARYLKFHNTSGTPTAGSGVTDAYLIPGNTAGAGLAINIDKGIAFSTGIGITLVTGITDASTTAIGASEVVINVYYK